MRFRLVSASGNMPISDKEYVYNDKGEWHVNINEVDELMQVLRDGGAPNGIIIDELGDEPCITIYDGYME